MLAMPTLIVSPRQPAGNTVPDTNDHATPSHHHIHSVYTTRVHLPARHDKLYCVPTTPTLVGYTILGYWPSFHIQTNQRSLQHKQPDNWRQLMCIPQYTDCTPGWRAQAQHSYSHMGAHHKP